MTRCSRPGPRGVADHPVVARSVRGATQHPRCSGRCPRTRSSSARRCAVSVALRQSILGLRSNSIVVPFRSDPIRSDPRAMFSGARVGCEVLSRSCPRPAHSPKDPEQGRTLARRKPTARSTSIHHEPPIPSRPESHQSHGAVAVRWRLLRERAPESPAVVGR